MGVNLYDFGLAIVFLAMRPKIQALKENIDKMGFIKEKKKMSFKEHYQKVKRQLTEWGKYFQTLY